MLTLCALLLLHLFINERKKNPVYVFIYFKNFLKTNLFLAALGLRCCARVFSSCGERWLLFVAVRGLLIVVASLVAEHGLQ